MIIVLGFLTLKILSERYESDPNFKTDWDKLIEEETRLRKQVMKRVIKSRGEKVPKVKTEKELQDIENKRIEKIEEAFAFIESRKKRKENRTE